MPSFVNGSPLPAPHTGMCSSDAHPPGSDTPRPATFHMPRALTPRGPVPRRGWALSLWGSGTLARPPSHGVASCSRLVLTVPRATAAPCRRKWPGPVQSRVCVTQTLLASSRFSKQSQEGHTLSPA